MNDDRNKMTSKGHGHPSQNVLVTTRSATKRTFQFSNATIQPTDGQARKADHKVVKTGISSVKARRNVVEVGRTMVFSGRNVISAAQPE